MASFGPNEPISRIVGGVLGTQTILTDVRWVAGFREQSCPTP